MEEPCRIELFGGLRVRQQDRAFSRFNTHKTGALLAYLAWRIPVPQPREVLIDLLWPDADPSAARASLSSALSSLRHQLEPPGIAAGSIITADRFSVGLNQAAVVTDVTEFEAAIRHAGTVKSDDERIR